MMLSEARLLPADWLPPTSAPCSVERIVRLHRFPGMIRGRNPESIGVGNFLATSPAGRVDRRCTTMKISRPRAQLPDGPPKPGDSGSLIEEAAREESRAAFLLADCRAFRGRLRNKVADRQGPLAVTSWPLRGSRSGRLVCPRSRRTTARRISRPGPGTL